MSITNILSALQTNTTLRQQVGLYGWGQEQKERADAVKRYRNYYDGNHDVKLTAEMKTMLRETDTYGAFSANYCQIIIDKIADRLTLERVEADNDTASDWAADILKDNRLDALQVSLHEATPRDGDSFVLVDWDNVLKRVVLTHEPAFDGEHGMAVLYAKANDNAPLAAVKVWYVTELVTDANGTQTAKDVARVTVYTADTIERYQGSVGNLAPLESANDIAPGVQKNFMGKVPVIHFKNKSSNTDNYGRSELKPAIPLQNILNRTLVSMVMTSENTSFQRLVAYNFEPPNTVSPGGWIQVFDPEDAVGNKQARVDVLPVGQIVPFTQQADWTINQIATVTSTPLPGWESAGESGEAKKQREEGLLGKLRRAQIGYGNAWEDTLKMAHLCQSTYGKKPPAYQSFSARWASAEVRNNAEVVANVMAVKDILPKEELLRLLAPVFGWDDAKVEQLMAQANTENDARMARMGVPMFTAVAAPAPQPQLNPVNQAIGEVA